MLCLLATTVTCSLTAGVATAAAPVNNALPSISGTAKQGQTLTFTPGTWTDPPGTFTTGDVWESCAGAACSPITPQPVGGTYPLTAADVGHTIEIVETATANDGTGATTVNSVPTASVTALPPGIVTFPSITGTAQVGSVLTLIQGQWSNSPSITDQWEHCDIAGLNCQPVSGATGATYAVGPTDVGFTIEVLETAANTGGTVTASTNPTFVVVAPPTEISAPSISGVPSQGSLLSENHGTWTGNPTSYIYQWERCINGACIAILGANSPTYIPTALDVGATILVAETAINIGGPSAAANSPVTGVVTTPAGIVPVPANISPPTVSGLAQQGQTLLEANGTWSNNPSSYSYQWVSCVAGGCAPVPGATAQAYTPTAADVGHAIVVLETATNSGGGSAPVATAQTAVVSSTSATSLAVSPDAPMTNQTVTLVATITSSSGNAYPSGQLTFFNGKHPIGGCANKALRATSQSVTLICQSSFAAGTAGLTAVYTPTARSLVGSSASPLTNLNVGRDSTSTSLAVTKEVARNKPATYAATVILPVSNSGPIAPVGSIEFLDYGRPIAAFAHRPLKRLAAPGSKVRLVSAGTEISARYTGDSNLALFALSGPVCPGRGAFLAADRARVHQLDASVAVPLPPLLHAGDQAPGRRSCQGDHHSDHVRGRRLSIYQQLDPAQDRRLDQSAWGVSQAPPAGRIADHPADHAAELDRQVLRVHGPRRPRATHRPLLPRCRRKRSWARLLAAE